MRSLLRDCLLSTYTKTTLLWCVCACVRYIAVRTFSPHPAQDRVSAADELITLVRTAQDEAEAVRKAIQAKNTADFAARAVRLREVAVKFRKLKKAVRAVAPAVGCVPVDLLRSAAAGLALELVRISNVSGAGPNLEAAYRGTGTAAKSALQAAEILKTNGPEVLISDHWEQNTQVKAVDGSGNAVPVTPLVLAPTTTPAPPVPLRQRMERKLTPAEEKELRAHFDQQMVRRLVCVCVCVCVCLTLHRFKKSKSTCATCWRGSDCSSW